MRSGSSDNTEISFAASTGFRIFAGLRRLMPGLIFLPVSDSDQSLTVVVTRVIKPGCEAAFERAMKEFITIAWTFPGHLGMQMLRPAESDRSGEYTILARFESLAARRVFTTSPIYQEWMSKLLDQSIGAPVVRELSGIDGWLALSGRAGNPPKWKMALTVWVGVYLLSQAGYALLGPVIGSWPRSLQALLVSALVVAALTWLVLPPVTRTLQRWYFPANRR